MKIVFFTSDKPREHMLAEALKQGVISQGHKFEMRRTADYGETEDGDDLLWPGPSPDTDIAVVFGVKGKSRKIIEDHLAMGRTTFLLDKGYSRTKGEGGHTEYTRISINGLHPLDYMMKVKRRPDRFRKLNMRLQPRARTGKSGHVLYCGSTQKYHDFHRIGDTTAYATRVFRDLRKFTDRHFIYRPKPSSQDVEMIPGTSYSGGSMSMQDALRGCHVVVTHGSSAAMDAIIAGIPAIVLGDSIAKPVSETDVSKVNEPFWPNDDQRFQWACAMAYCQWTNDEMRSGEMWRYCMEEIERQKQEKENAE